MKDRSKQRTGNDVALVIGATGKTGLRVAARLAARGIATRAASRSGPTRFDWDDRKGWDAALEGASLAYVAYSPDLAVPEAPDAIRDLARLAAKHDIGRLVLLSGRGENEAQRCERIVQEIRPDWSVVRASWFNQNFSEAFFLEPLRHGELALPAGDIGEPFVDVEDIADVAVAALTEPGHEGRIYEVTGPRLLTFAEAVREVAEASGRNLRYRQVPIEEFVDGLRAQQLPEPLVSLTRYLFETVLDGRNSYVTDGVEQALGRGPRDFSDYVRKTAASGIWTEPVAAGATGS
jgi:uncharacterized protein YbjT (DUF2867 family)